MRRKHNEELAIELERREMKREWQMRRAARK